MHLGSPPPTRGTLTNQSTAEDAAGITPAYAGNTKLTAKICIQSGDHPRLRGEHYHLIKKGVKGLGSPPPTRGTLEI